MFDHYRRSTTFNVQPLSTFNPYRRSTTIDVRPLSTFDHYRHSTTIDVRPLSTLDHYRRFTTIYVRLLSTFNHYWLSDYRCSSIEDPAIDVRPVNVKTGCLHPFDVVWFWTAPWAGCYKYQLFLYLEIFKLCKEFKFIFFDRKINLGQIITNWFEILLFSGKSSYQFSDFSSKVLIICPQITRKKFVFCFGIMCI